MDPLGSLLIVMTTRLILFVLTRMEAAMAKSNVSLTSALYRLWEFVLNTLVAFGVVTILKAVMVPRALFLMPATRGAAD